MNECLKLSQAEWALIVDLLQEERDELPVEIHHCRVASYREELQRRQELVHRLLDRMRVAVEA